MGIRNCTCAVLAAVAISAVAGSASANVTAFDDAYQNSCDSFYSAGDALTIVDSPAARHVGDKALEGTASGPWVQIGVSLSNMVIPADATSMQFDIYFPTQNIFGNVFVQLGAPTWQQQVYSDGSNAQYFTVSGGGKAADMLPGTWYTLTMDLPGAYGSLVTPGTTPLLHVATQVNNPGTFYMDNVQLVSVPEPASIGLLGLASAALLRRWRHAR